MTETVLSYDEYIAFGGDKDKLAKEDFSDLLNDAEMSLNTLTNGFYNDPIRLADDYGSKQYNFRAKRYKQALTYQIRSFVTLGATTTAQLDMRPRSQSMGETTVSLDGPRQTGGRSPLVSQEAINLLEGTGLLYRGATLWTHC